MTFFGSKKAENLNRYSHFAPRMDWIKQFFKYKDGFFEKNNLGSVMLRFFKRFLLDAELLDQSCRFSVTADKISQLGIINYASWGIIMVNLSCGSPLVRWYLKRVIFDESYSKLCLVKMISDYGSKGGSDAVTALGQMCCLPLGEVGFGKSSYEDIYNGKRLLNIIRLKWEKPSDLVILYSLYKFAEMSGWNYGFKFEKLFDDSEEGVSPVKMFGINEKNMINILNGLAANYPDFVSVSFSLDIQSITLNPSKTSINVLDLITCDHEKIC